MNLSPLRFFLTIGLHPSHGLAALAAVVLVGVWTIWKSAGELDSALGMLLFAQMFLASSGFLVRARRGHFDLLLTSASGRERVLVCHWLASALPGLVAWVIVCLAAWTLGGSAWSAAALGSRFLAVLIVSALAWMAGLALPPGAGGVLWIAVLFAALLRRVDFAGWMTGSSTPVVALTRHAAAILVCPFLLLGGHSRFVASAITAGAGVALLLVSVWRFGDRFDFYLRDRT